jgi:hypothetical protein
MKIAICDDDKQELVQINRLMDEYLSCGFTEDKIDVSRFEKSMKLLAHIESGVHFDVDKRYIKTHRSYIPSPPKTESLRPASSCSKSIFLNGF